MRRTSVLFICNPVAGRKKASEVENNIGQYLDPERFDARCVFTSYAGHAETIARTCEADIVVAVGGDGTVNEVARGIIGTDKVMGIIPCGSGNGLAFHHGIPSDIPGALKVIAEGRISKLDTGRICNHVFCCSCGVGMDAQTSLLFRKSKRRGFLSYIMIGIRMFFTYGRKHYSITVDGKTFDTSAKMITIGNANQWGNNAFITPDARTDDGLLNMTIIERINILNVIPLLAHLFSGTLSSSPIAKTCIGKSFSITRDAAGPIHFDGDAVFEGRRLTVSIVPSSLKILSNRLD